MTKMMMQKKKKLSKEELIIQLVAISAVTLFCIFVILPFAVVIGSSFEKESNIAKYGFTIIPKTFSLEAYKVVFSDSQIYKAYFVTIFTTVVGTMLSLLFTITLAYPLAQKKLKFRHPITFYVYFTMLFNGGLVPLYLLISKYLHMKDNIWVLIIPILFSPWNMFLMRNFFSAIPKELAESAYIDGANDFQVLFQVILPISKPALATIGLFYALTYWNQWYNAMLYIDNRDLMPLQYLIMDLMRSTDAIKEMAKSTGISTANLPTSTLKMATTIITIGPVILLYPFAQKYFTEGLTVGAIKG